MGGVCTGNRETVESPATRIILSPGALNPHCAEESAFHPEGAGESRSEVRPRHYMIRSLEELYGCRARVKKNLPTRRPAGRLLAEVQARE